MGMARAMLRTAKLPNRFWSFAVEYAVYLRNRLVKPGSGKTRYELLMQKPPEYKHAHNFGAEVMVLDPREDKAKLADRGNAGIFVGVDVESHTYKIYLVKEKKVIRSRDVKFYSNKEFELIEKEEVLTAEEENVSEPFIPSSSSSLSDPPSLSTSPDNYVSTPTLTNSNFEVRDDYDSDSEDELYDLPVRSPLTNDHSPPIPPPITVHIPPIQEQIFREPIMTRSKTTGAQIRSIVEDVSTLGRIEEPTSIKEALDGPHSQQWKQAIEKELVSLSEMNTWEKVDERTLTTDNRKAYHQAVGSKWVLKVKYDEEGKVDRFKARLVAKGYSQVEGLNYHETYSPTLSPVLLRYILSYGVGRELEVDHIDVESAFLQGDLNEEVFMRLPDMCGSDSGKVVRLLRPIYGLKQASRCFNEKYVKFLLSLNFKQSSVDPCVFIRDENGERDIISIFVDDNILVGKRERVDALKKIIADKFKIRDLGPIKFILGIKVEREGESLFLSQENYISTILDRFGMTNCKLSATPMPIKLEKDSKEALTPFKDITLYQQLIGSLIYVSNNTRPDITYAVSVLARKMSNPSEYDFNLGKRILRYLKGTISTKLSFTKREELCGYSDSSYGESDDRKSTTGFVFVINGGAIDWKAKKQPIVTCSSTEAEYVALSTTCKESLWLSRLEREFIARTTGMTLFEDNQSTIKLTNNNIINDRSKHIDIRYHFIRDRVNGSKEAAYCDLQFD